VLLSRTHYEAFFCLNSAFWRLRRSVARALPHPRLTGAPALVGDALPAICRGLPPTRLEFTLLDRLLAYPREPWPSASTEATRQCRTHLIRQGARLVDHEHEQVDEEPLQDPAMQDAMALSDLLK
jgi:hypothetical protein